MHYQKFAPSSELAPFVECYFVWEGETTERLEVQSPPNCFGAIVFNYGDPSWATQHSTDEIPVPEAFVCGVTTSNYQRILRGRIGMFGIVFKISTIHNLFRLRMSALVNNRMPLDLFLENDDVLLPGKMKEAPDVEARIQLSEKFLLPKVPNAKANLSIIDEALDWIDENNGHVAIEAVSAKFGISKRYLEKHFLVKVGVSPKFYARIKRFGIVSNKVAHSKNVDWQDIVYENGFHDQSHLTKEFMEFNKQSPASYHRNHHEMTRFLKEKKPGDS